MSKHHDVKAHRECGDKAYTLALDGSDQLHAQTALPLVSDYQGNGVCGGEVMMEKINM
jgi:hypothetical protein